MLQPLFVIIFNSVVYLLLTTRFQKEGLIMKKLFMLLLSLLLVFSFAACSNGTTEEISNDRPPAFSVLQKQTTLIKQSEKGTNASFTKADFQTLVGETVTYITVTELPETKLGTLIFNGAAVTKGQTIPAGSLDYLKFVPNTDSAKAVFGFTCDSKNFDGRELKCEIVFTDGANSPPIAVDSNVKTVSGISCESVLKINEPNGDDFTINVITYPTDGYIDVSADGKVIYTSKDGFSGNDRMIYTVTDRFGAVSEKATLEINVEKNENKLYFADMEENMLHLYAHRMCRDDVMVYRYEDGKYLFDPDKPVSKIEFLVMLMNVTGEDTDIVAVADSAIADDNGLSSGLKGYLSAASEKGLIKLQNGYFSPKETITVADAAYMITASLDLPMIRSEDAIAENSNNALSSILAASNAGFFDKVEPSHTLTKAETAKLLCNVEDYMSENNMKTLGD